MKKCELKKIISECIREVYNQSVNEYDTPESFDKDRLNNLVDYVFNRGGKVLPFIRRQFMGYKPQSTEKLFKHLLKQGYTSDEINTVRAMGVKVIEGLMKSKRIMRAPKNNKAFFNYAFINRLPLHISVSEFKNHVNNIFKEVENQTRYNLLHKFGHHTDESNEIKPYIY